MSSADTWSPDQYQKFAAERAKPFYDLLALVTPVPGGDVVDLGCGTGELTADLHQRTQAARTLGTDSSPAMLAKAEAHAGAGLTFERSDIETWTAESAYDVVFSNAALQWCTDHPALLGRLRDALKPHGQLAIQVPANFDHPSHTLAAEVAHEPAFLERMTAPPPEVVNPVLTPVEYAELLHQLGFGAQRVRLEVYGHTLESTAAVAEWTKGTALQRYQRLLPPSAFSAFVDRYTDRLVDTLGDQRPYFYPFKRILLWAQLP
jgi:trans-aconitate 2-methyltransferase